MALVEFTEKDILRNTIVEPDWYRVRIDAVHQSIAKSGTSQNIRLEGVIICNASNGEKKYEGVPTPYLWMFNTAMIGQMIPLLSALGEEVKQGYRFDPDGLPGKEVEVFIGQGTFNNNIQNQMSNQYRKAI